MLDIQFIKENKQKIAETIQNKGIDLNLEYLLDLDDKRRTLKMEVDELRQKRNQITEQIKTGEKSKSLIENAKEIKKLLGDLEDKYKQVQEEFDHLMHFIPNIPSEDTPIGKNEDDNIVVDEVGTKKTFDFPAKDHIELGKKLDIIDFDRGTKVSGYRGYYVKNEGVLLMLGMMNYALHKMISKGYTPMIPPTLVKEFTLRGSGYFAGAEYNDKTDEVYRIASRDKEVDGTVSKDRKFLIGTAEPSLLAYHADEVLDKKDLPIKLCAFSQCYRSEIGSYGKETKGLYRVHEFMKIEQVVLMEANEESSNKMQQEMMDITKEMYEEIGFTYRTLLMCTGEQSAGKYKYYDLEVWSPGLKRWLETASASNFLDWQARRLNVRYKAEDGTNKFVYMLNNTGLPTPRPFIAILENFQQKNGTIKVPEVLQKWVGTDVIKAKK